MFEKLVLFLESQPLFVRQLEEDNSPWGGYSQEAQEVLLYALNKKYQFLKNSIKFILPSGLSDDYIFEFEKKYVLLHDSYPDVNWAIKHMKTFNTPKKSGSK